jgi:hypothetical protein
VPHQVPCPRGGAPPGRRSESRHRDRPLRRPLEANAIVRRNPLRDALFTDCEAHGQTRGTDDLLMQKPDDWVPSCSADPHLTCAIRTSPQGCPAAAGERSSSRLRSPRQRGDDRASPFRCSQHHSGPERKAGVRAGSTWGAARTRTPRGSGRCLWRVVTLVRSWGSDGRSGVDRRGTMV